MNNKRKIRNIHFSKLEEIIIDYCNKPYFDHDDSFKYFTEYYYKNGIEIYGLNTRLEVIKTLMRPLYIIRSFRYKTPQEITEDILEQYNWEKYFSKNNNLEIKNEFEQKCKRSIVKEIFSFSNSLNIIPYQILSIDVYNDEKRNKAIETNQQLIEMQKFYKMQQLKSECWFAGVFFIEILNLLTNIEFKKKLKNFEKFECLINTYLNHNQDISSIPYIFCKELFVCDNGK